MSQQLINHNTDLKKLRDEGYEIRVVSGLLVMQNVPYVNSKKEVKRASLVSEATLAGDKTLKPNDHVVSFTGEHPCNKGGSPMTKIVNSSGTNKLTDGLIAQYKFSSKPKGGYRDHYEKMSTYANLISSPAQALDPTVTARTYAAIEPDEEDSIFNYIDTASSRAGIIETAQKLALQKIAIIGVGGTGSYILDLVAKTLVKQIHLYDNDMFFQHSAFRAPGAPSLEELKKQYTKVEYLKTVYSKMRKGVIAHNYNIDNQTIEELREMGFVFICIDDGELKKMIFRKLEEFGVPFIDVGMGLYLDSETLTLGGQLRVTASTVDKRDHIKKRVSFSKGNGNNEYDRNIQIADLNALNASMAVIKWKQIFGFYQDLENQHNSIYAIDGNVIINEDKPDDP